MKRRQFHKKWGEKYQIQPEAIDCAYALIEGPVKQMEYLRYLVNVTKWWDDDAIKYIPSDYRRDFKTAERREKTEQEYEKYLSEHIRGVIRRGLKPNKQAKNKTMLQRKLFHGSKTGRALSRAKDKGSLQSYVQQKHALSKGRSVLLAWYLHHLTDYCREVHKTLPLDEIIRRNQKRINPICPSDYDEIVSFVRQKWEDLKRDF